MIAVKKLFVESVVIMLLIISLHMCIITTVALLKQKFGVENMIYIDNNINSIIYINYTGFIIGSTRKISNFFS